MTQNRTDLNYENHNSTYIILTVILVILTLFIVYLFAQLQTKTSNPAPISTPTSTPTPKLIETDEPTSAPNPTPTVLPTATEASPEAKPTAATTPVTQSFTSPTDNFSVEYKSYRKLYQDKESTGNRYTFYSKSGNIAIHTGTQWSWTYPNREFTNNLLVSDKPTFVYDLDSQKIIDFENGDNKFTIQCIHHGLTDLKSECNQFIARFQLK